MNQDQDFAALRNLLALKKLETPLEKNVDRFLIEFHRRQRAQLLVPESRFARVMAWIRERAESFAFVPSLSYASAFAAIALTAFLGLSQQVQVTHSESGQYKLSFHMPSTGSSFAMIPASFSKASSLSASDTPHFNTNGSAPTTTCFVLANNPRLAYDASVAF
jgi:hypothetical protein